MEGALVSVLGGLVDKPVFAVPSGIGYGANYGGIATLLAMLNSCASGVAVLNIGNGFGAGYLAATIGRQLELARGNRTLSRILYLDCFSGISGDMFLGALLAAGASPDAIRAGLSRLGLDDEFSLVIEPGARQGITGISFDVDVHPQQAAMPISAGATEHGHDHPHDHDHEHPHDHDHEHAHDHDHEHPHDHEHDYCA